MQVHRRKADQHALCHLKELEFLATSDAITNVMTTDKATKHVMRQTFGKIFDTHAHELTKLFLVLHRAQGGYSD